MSDTEQVVAVLVTWNRRELLAESLAAVLAQSRAPEAVIVVDNASTDGTADVVAADFPTVRLVRTRHNAGGAGGFAVGIATALAGSCDALWLLDDDTVPRGDALTKLLTARRSYRPATPALVASRVVWTDGREHPMNTPRPKPGASSGERAAASDVGCTPIRSASFVSVLVNAATVRERGLPVADYFLWNDDFEFTARMIRGGAGLYCPGSTVVHKTRTFGSTDADPGDRFYFEVRNKVWVFGRSRALGPAEKAVYGGATLRRWGRTIMRSQARGTLLRCLGRGLRDGLRAGPRPTDEVIRQAIGATSDSEPGRG